MNQRSYALPPPRNIAPSPLHVAGHRPNHVLSGRVLFANRPVVANSSLIFRAIAGICLSLTGCSCLGSVKSLALTVMSPDTITLTAPTSRTLPPFDRSCRHAELYYSSPAHRGKLCFPPSKYFPVTVSSRLLPPSPHTSHN